MYNKLSFQDQLSQKYLNQQLLQIQRRKPLYTQQKQKVKRKKTLPCIRDDLEIQLQNRKLVEKLIQVKYNPAYVKKMYMREDMNPINKHKLTHHAVSRVRSPLNLRGERTDQADVRVYKEIKKALGTTFNVIFCIHSSVPTKNFRKNIILKCEYFNFNTNQFIIMASDSMRIDTNIQSCKKVLEYCQFLQTNGEKFQLMANLNVLLKSLSDLNFIAASQSQLDERKVLLEKISDMKNQLLLKYKKQVHSFPTVCQKVVE